MAGQHDQIDLEQVGAARDLDVVQQQPVGGRAVAQMRDHAPLGVVDRTSPADDLCHGDHPCRLSVDNMLS
ncbi:hypothetical protein [Nonomuraea dietziae]|uniref:hypothetical protein n=1 Tax=Nonomuraea dietziae TaxID=65515 RepID=UPI0031D7A4E0